jgi:NADH:ubiquinone reductase (H+-translocating)
LAVSTGPTASRSRVLVLGAGFAGVAAVRSLKDTEVDIVLVDRHDYHTFQPLLYQVASALLETDAVGHPIRGLFQDQSNVTVHQATISAINLKARRVDFADMAPITYDYLVLALGAVVNFLGTAGAAEHAFPMYTLPDAVALRNHLLRKWEAVDRDPRLLDDGGLNIVVVGGGTTGVESAGALAELYRSNFAKDYPQIPVEKTRITLIEAGPEIFATFTPELRRYTTKALKHLGVDVLVGESVSMVTPTRVTVKSGAALRAHTLVWGAGLLANPLVHLLGIELQPGDRVRVEPDLSVPGRPEVFVAGDIAAIDDPKTQEVLPQLGSVASQAGGHVGANIAHRVNDTDTDPFTYHDKGTMATIGPGAAVVQLHNGRTIKGKTAFLAWGAVHLALLSTGEDRSKAVMNWTWAMITRDRPARIIVEPDTPPSNC